MFSKAHSLCCHQDNHVPLKYSPSTLLSPFGHKITALWLALSAFVLSVRLKEDFGMCIV